VELGNRAAALDGKILIALDRALRLVTTAASVLVLPLALLLCAQWPLRDLLHAYSREANDLAQLLFGLYVAIAVTYATRCRGHLTPDTLARHYPPRVRRWIARVAAVAIAMPWSLFVLYAAAPMAWLSLRQLEGFPDTFNPGYFILKLGVCVLAALVFLQAIVDIFHPGDPAVR